MSEFNPYQPPALPIHPPAPIVPPFPDGPRGLGGWLLLVGMGIVVSPFRMFADLNSQFKLVREGGLWAELTTPGSQSYHPAWKPYLITELAYNVAFVALWIFLAFLFFSKKQAFPRWYIGAQIASLVCVVLDAAFITILRPELPLFDIETSKQLVQAMVGVCIWVPYMMKSQRVAATFVRA